jgi:ATP-dependent exoDNAse (exonuclease V) beta subunit
MRRSAVLGTVVHEYLACLSGDKSRQNPEHLHSLREEISRRFQLEGYVADADTLAQSCLQMLMRSIESETGTWILASHPQAAAEFEVCGMYDGETVVGVVDRTFVDATTGVRWIIDYKSALPENGEALDIFLERQRSMYAPQLERYIALMQRLEPDRRCRAGLYFPACDAWCEC